MNPRTLYFIIVIVAASVGAGIWIVRKLPRPAPRVTVQLESVSEDAVIIHAPDGTHRARLATREGPLELSGEEFLARVYNEHSHRPWWMLILNITTPIGIAWVVLGLGGQVMFTGRMIVQLFASEKTQRSVVPPAFWWMSLIGATMLLIYFAWRKDIVGIIGQSIGWVIYIRNLQLIYAKRSRPSPASASATDEPVLPPVPWTAGNQAADPRE